MEGVNDPLSELIKQSPRLAKILAEIDELWKNRKNKEFFTAREAKELDLKVLDFMQECAEELSKIKDPKIRKETDEAIYGMRYNFYLNLNEKEEEIVLSDPVDEMFDTFQTEKSPQKTIKKIKLARKELSEVYVGF